jgi:hypothetical protein
MVTVSCPDTPPLVTEVRTTIGTGPSWIADVAGESMEEDKLVGGEVRRRNYHLHRSDGCNKIR